MGSFMCKAQTRNPSVFDSLAYSLINKLNNDIILNELCIEHSYSLNFKACFDSSTITLDDINNLKPYNKIQLERYLKNELGKALLNIEKGECIRGNKISSAQLQLSVDAERQEITVQFIIDVKIESKYFTISIAHNSRLGYDTKTMEKLANFGIDFRRSYEKPKNPKSWTCGNTITDVEGNTYKTIRIGNQCWMAENLKTSKYADGTLIPEINRDRSWEKTTEGAWCYYNNTETQKDYLGSKLGKLYNGYAVLSHHKLCPINWRVPAFNDWQKLDDEFGIHSGTYLKSAYGWKDHGGGIYTDDGFQALPGGFRNYNGKFMALNDDGHWWTYPYVGESITNKHSRLLEHNSISLTTGMVQSNNIGLSVRCIWDKDFGTITELNCSSTKHTGKLTIGHAAINVSSEVPYTGGLGGSYTEKIVESKGVVGLTAILEKGYFANGAGTLKYIINGTPSTSGTAIFELKLGGQCCTLYRTVLPVGVITEINCASSINTAPLTANKPVSGINCLVNYTGGNGGIYDGQIATSKGVIGLTATLVAGSLANGAGALTYSISGTPSTSGSAIFELKIGGKSCSLNIPVLPSWNCGETISDIDGNSYKTVKIFNQCWMAENLNTLKYRDGTSIPYIEDDNAWNQLSTAACCYYNQPKELNTSLRAKLGLLYNWYVVENNHGLCPAGWHVPTEEEWIELTDSLGPGEGAAIKMKSTIGWENNRDGNSGNGTNITGFDGLPGGYRSPDAKFKDIGTVGHWWCSQKIETSYNAPFGWLQSNNDLLEYSFQASKKHGYSVRCIKD
jgi:uncharacterized protein (TIGR02145 family)